MKQRRKLTVSESVLAAYLESGSYAHLAYSQQCGRYVCGLVQFWDSNRVNAYVDITTLRKAGATVSVYDFGAVVSSGSVEFIALRSPPSGSRPSFITAASAP